METLSKLTFKELNQLLIDIAERFFQSHLNDDLYFLKVQKAYSRLSNSNKNLINNEFFYQNYHLWWQGLYSKATFYRYKKEAMVSFLEAFYNE